MSEPTVVAVDGVERPINCPLCALALSSNLWMFCEAELCPMRAGGGEPRIVREVGYTPPEGKIQLNHEIITIE